MGKYAFFFILCPAAILGQTLNITNGPMDTTVCNGETASISCGFINANPNNVVPNWRIIMRSDNGSIISNMIVSGTNIIGNNILGLQWVPDTASGVNMSPKSKLLVGPVDGTYNQSSYQCIFATSGGNVESSVGTLTVAGPPPLINNLTVRDVDICDTTISGFSFKASSGNPVCGQVSHNVTVLPSDGVMIMRINDTYNITGLTPATSYSITVISSNMAGAVESMVRVDTPSSSEALPSGVINLMNTTYYPYNITLSWVAANSSYCGGVLDYIVTISSDEHYNITNDTVVVTLFNVTFSNLKNDTNYNITVAAINTAGAGMIESIKVATSPFVAPQTNNENDDDEGDADHIIVIIYCAVGVIIACISCMAALYCSEKIMEKRGDNEGLCSCVLILFSCGTVILIRTCWSTRNKYRRIFFLICSLFLGYVIWKIYSTYCLEENRARRKNDTNNEHTKPKTNGASESECALYAYARTGPVNVVFPGTPSEQMYARTGPVNPGTPPEMEGLNYADLQLKPPAKVHIDYPVCYAQVN